MPLPELIEIVPIGKPVRAEITVPGSKSITNRALILAALAEGEVTLEGALWSEDTQIMVECLQELGFMVDVQRDAREACNRTITVYGKGGGVPSGGTEERPMELFVGNAGTAARFLAAFVCLGKGVYRLHGVPRMHERPQGALFAALRELGYVVETESGNDKLPVRIGVARREVSGSESRGRAEQRLLLTSAATDRGARTCRVSIEKSSQFASALLLCARTGGWQVEVTGENAEESPYVAMTLKLIETFPSRGGRFEIEPDASSGSYFWAAGKIAESAEFMEYAPQFGVDVSTRIANQVTVAAWPGSGWQVDERFLDFLAYRAGLHDAIEFQRSREVPAEEVLKAMVSRGAGDVSRAVDLGDSILLAIVITPLGNDPIRFTDLGRLRVQECERVVALRTELTKCGAKVVEAGDTLTVYPSKLHGAEIETYNDHRMAMCFAILGLKVPGIKLTNPACVKKTFPNFFQKLAAPPPEGLGATILDARNGRALTQDELFAE